MDHVLLEPGRGRAGGQLMRLEARVLEGDETTAVLVPLRSLLTFKKDTKHGIDWWISQSRLVDSEVEGLDWEPRLVWQTMRDVNDEVRSFDDWTKAVEWAAIFSAPDQLDPSGGEATPTPAPSPESSSEPVAPGESSSGSTTTSSTPSGTTSEA